MPLLDSMLGLSGEYARWIVAALSYVGSACLGALFFWWRARRARWYFENKEFPNHVNFSLNDFDGPRLVMRTVLESPADQVWLNDHVIRLIERAVKKTTVEDAILRLDDAADMDFLNRAVVNKLSPLFRGTFLARSLGQPVAVATYVFAVTFEKFQNINTRKLRVLIIKEQGLAELEFPPDQTDARLRERMATLVKMYHLYADPATRRVLGQVELGVPVSALTGESSAPMP